MYLLIIIKIKHTKQRSNPSIQRPKKPCSAWQRSRESDRKGEEAWQPNIENERSRDSDRDSEGRGGVTDVLDFSEFKGLRDYFFQS